MMNVLLLMTVSGVISPVSAPFSTRQYFGSPDHPARVLPSKMGLKPGSSPTGASGRSLCLGTYCAISGEAASALRNTLRLVMELDLRDDFEQSLEALLAGIHLALGIRPVRLQREGAFV